MALDLVTLIRTRDIRDIPRVHERVVRAFRYTHFTQRAGRYSHRDLVHYLGHTGAIRTFHVFFDELRRSWPEPLVFGRPSDKELSYDEMLIVDLIAAARRSARAEFDALIDDMIGPAVRQSLWATTIRFVRATVWVA